MRAGVVALASLLVVAGGSGASATSPPEDDAEVTLDDLLDAEDSFALQAEDAGFTELDGFACAIRELVATCYASQPASVVRGVAPWDELKPTWTFTEFGSEPAATDVPAGEQGTRQSPTPIGTEAPVGGGWTAIVNSVNLDATDVVLAANQFNEPPIAGSQYVLANVTITYNGTEASDSTGVRFQALGPSNVALDAGGSTYVTPPAPLEAFTEVFQGGSLTGDIVFEVPSADVGELVIIGHAFMSYEDDERSFFATV